MILYKEIKLTEIAEVIKLKGKKYITKALSVLLSLIVIASSLAPMSLAAVTYPQGITEKQAETAMKQTDNVLKSIVQNIEGESLADVVLSMVFCDSTLTSLAKTFYSMSEDNAEIFATIGLDFSPSAVSAYLSDYPDAEYAFASAGSWSSLDETEIEWGIESATEFIEAAVDLFTPMNDLLYTILCAGSYQVSPLVGLKGAKGYSNSVVRIFIKCGMDVYTDAETFEAQAKEDKSTMVRNIVSDLVRYITRICSAPASMLSSKLPGIAYFIQNGGLDDAVTRLVDPLRLQILGITTPFKVGSIMDSALQGQEGMSLDFSLDLNSISASGTLKTAPFDLAELASLAIDDIDTYIVKTADSFIYILRWIIETVKLNASELPSMLSGTENAIDKAQLQQLLTKLFSKSTDELMTVYVNLLSQTEGKTNPYVWSFPQITPAQISYTPNLGQEKYQRVLDGIDELISQFIKESGEAESFRKSMQPQLYSNKVVTELVTGIYGMLSKDELGGMMSLLGIDLSPSALAKTLTEEKYATARQTLESAESYTKLTGVTVNWGFKDGSKNDFGKAVCAVLRPLDPILRMLLCSESADFLGGIPFYGSDGYNTAVIPLLEAVGCTFETIRTYDEFCQQSKNTDVFIPIMKSILSLTERILDKPVYTLTGILPNLMYFINGGGIETCIKNLLYPITSTLETVGLSDMVDLSAVTAIDTDKLVGELTKKIDLGVKLPELDLKQFGTTGTLVPANTKRTQAGQPMTIQYLQPDRTGVLITFLRYVVQIMKTPGNEGIVDSFMNSTGEENEMFSTYSQGIDEELAKMSVDETVEWLYKIFFRERATVEEKDSDFAPTVIYTENKKINWTAVAGVGVALVAVVMIGAMLNRDKLVEVFSKMKKKKTNNEEEA